MVGEAPNIRSLFVNQRGYGKKSLVSNRDYNGLNRNKWAEIINEAPISRKINWKGYTAQ